MNTIAFNKDLKRGKEIENDVLEIIKKNIQVLT